MPPTASRRADVSDVEEEDEVLWSMSCGACDHEWMQTTPADSDPKTEEVECPECGSGLVEAVYAGRS